MSGDHNMNQKPAGLDPVRAALDAPEGVALSDERIDAIADLVVKGMPDGVQGFLKSWGWRQFARALLEDCRGHYRADQSDEIHPEIDRLCHRITELEDELHKLHSHRNPLYRMSTPQRQPLPVHEIVTLYDECPRSDADMIEFARAIEAFHGIGAGATEGAA